MLNHGFYNGTKINNLKNYISDKIAVQISLHYTQIEVNSSILEGMFSNFKLIFKYFLKKIKIFYFSHYNGAHFD